MQKALLIIFLLLSTTIGLPIFARCDYPDDLARLMKRAVLSVLVCLSIASPAMAEDIINPRMNSFFQDNLELIQMAEKSNSVLISSDERKSCLFMRILRMEPLLRVHIVNHHIQGESEYESRKYSIVDWLIISKITDEACKDTQERKELARFFRTGLIDRFINGENVFEFRNGNLQPRLLSSPSTSP